MEELIPPATGIAQLGVLGLLFYMWWTERADKMKSEEKRNEAESDREALLSALEESQGINHALIEVVMNNTRAVTVLGERLSQRPCLVENDNA